VYPDTLLAAGDTQLFTFVARFNTTAIGLYSGSDLRLETIVTLGNAGGANGSGSIGSRMDIDGNGQISTDEWLVRSVVDRFQLILDDVQGCRDQVTFFQGDDEISTTDGLDMDTVTTVGEGGNGSQQINSSQVFYTWISVPGESSETGVVTIAPWITSGTSTNLTVPVFDSTDLIQTCCEDAYDLVGGFDSTSFNITSGIVGPQILSTDVCAYTHREWAATPDGTNIATRLHQEFEKWYPAPGYLRVGIPSNFYMNFSSAAHVQAYLGEIDSDIARILYTNVVNPRSPIFPGFYGHQLLALQLNVDVFPALGRLFYCTPGPENTFYFYGRTVKQILAWGHSLLGGGPFPPNDLNTPPSFLDEGDIDTLIENINEGAKDCMTSAWFAEHLFVDECPPPF
jgi:hypothetical protein